MNTTQTYTTRGAYSLATGARLPDQTHTVERLGVAPIVRRRSSTFPCRMTSYFDLTQWRGGFMRVTGAPGSAVLPGGVTFDMRTGVVSRDSRFA